MSDLVIIDPKEYGLQEEAANGIQAAFAPSIAERQGLASIYEQLITMEITPECCAEAGALRKKLAKVRTAISKTHKAQKAFALATGRYLDAWKNKETLPITQMEENLKELENHFEYEIAQEVKRLQAERVLLLSPFVEDSEMMDLGTMGLDVFNAYLGAKTKEHEEKQEAERKAKVLQEAIEIEAEKERKEAAALEAEKQAKIQAENKKLRAQAKQQQMEKEAAQKIQALKDLKAKEERLAIEKEQSRIKKANADLLAKAKAKEQAKKDEEKRLEQEKAQKEQAELNKNDSEKVKDLISELEAIKDKFSFSSSKNKAMYKSVGGLIDKVTGYIKSK
jgi:myosin heavy subunit